MTQRQKTTIKNTILIVLLGIGAILMLFPFYVTVVNALKTPEQSAQSFFSLPKTFYLGNIKGIIENAKFFTYLRNSLVITIVAVASIIIIAPTVSYAISRNMKQSKFYRIIYFMFVGGVFIPFQVLMLPITRLVTNYGLNNQLGLILLYVTFGLTQGVFLCVGYLKSIPIELDEAAEIDGGNVFQTYRYIIFPLMKPIMSTLVILNSLWIFNDFLLPILILNRSSDMWTLPLFQYNFQGQYTFNYNMAFASYLFTIVPMLILYMFMQRYIAKGLTEGAIK